MNAFLRAVFETITFAWIIILAAVLSPQIALAQSPVGFKMPSNNIYCMLESPYNNDGLRCDIRVVTDSLPPQPASCQFGWGKSFEITPNGSVGTRICVSDTVYNPTFPALTYGTQWNEGGLICKSAEAGLTCTNAAGHGFMISKEVQKLF